MWKSPLCLFALTLLTETLAAQAPVDYRELTFNSTFEKEILIDHFQNKKSDPFLLLMANGNLLNEEAIQQAERDFYSHIALLQDEKIQLKKNDKKTRYVYDDIHRKFLKKYEEGNRFEEIFKNGFYNCVSASALYALAFNKLNIPYVIKEQPSHVYLIAYPETDRIKVETTSPINGSQTIDAKFKEMYVKMLKEQKLISAQEYAMQDINTLFDKFYFSDQEDITLLNLVGIQYMNDGLYQYNDHKYEESFAQIEKAYLFFPHEKTEYLLRLTASQAFEARKQKDTIQATYLGKLSRYKNIGVDKEMITGEFVRVIRELLFTEGKKQQLTLYYQKLKQLIYDADLKKEIDFIYNYECGRLLYNQAKYKDAVPYFETALQLKPKDQDTNTLFISAVGESLRATADNLTIIKTLDSYIQKYPDLHDNNIFNNLIAATYLIQFGIEYSTEKSVQGDKYKVLFEAHCAKYPGLTINSDLIGQAYSVAAVYYFRKGQNTKAKSIISKGLEISPNNYELLQRQQMIK
jgi:tetratricopeptide (TPR) repeat protein